MKLFAIVSLAAVLLVSACATPPVAATALPAVANAVSPAPGVVAAGRLVPEDIERVRNAGIRHVVDLTPDGETPDFDEAAAVRAAGLTYSNLPVSGPADLTLRNVQAFDAMLQGAQRPTLVHCGSGNRVGAMAALRAAWVDGRTIEDAIAIGKAWGLGGLEAEVRRLIEAGP